MDLSRRQVLKLGLGVAGSCLFSKHLLFAAECTSPCIKIVPIDGVRYPASFLEFANRARFKTPRDAIASVRDRRLSYDLVWQS